MKIIACNNINHQTTSLEYTSDRKNAPPLKSYSISSDKAEEFVKKYNKQSQILANFSAATTIAGGFTGFVLSLGEAKFIKSVFKTITGILAGFILSSFIAYKCNDKLMDKYNVTENKFC